MLNIVKSIMFFLICLALVACSVNTNEPINSSIESATGKHTITLTFNEVPTSILKPSKPPQELNEIRTIALSKTKGALNTLQLYQNEDETDTYAFIKHNDIYYSIGVYSVNPDEVKIKEINENIGSHHLLLGIGTDYTMWNLVAMKSGSDSLVEFGSIGQPYLIDLESNGKNELVCSFEGVHLNFPNVQIFREKDNRLESAIIINKQDNENPEYARFLFDDETLFEISKVREEGNFKRYQYQDGLLVEK